MIPSLSHTEPILAVADLAATIRYWQEVLGFPEQWTWGNPPDYAGISWNGVQIQFSLDPVLAAASKGNAIFIRVRHLEALYKLHQERGADIVAPLENHPWGMAGYTVRDNNGYYLNFAGQTIEHREQSKEGLPDNIRIIEKTPFNVIAEDITTGTQIGTASLIGEKDNYYLTGVEVHPDWQGKKIGTALVQKLMGLVKDNATVTLISKENLSSFYQQFGFTPAFGMIRMKKTITISPWSEEWPLQFNQLKSLFDQHLKELIIGIEHVGSTSVPGLVAKPIIDIDIIIKDKSRFEEIVAILKTLGYTHEGERGIPGREAFRGPLHPPHHLYVCLEDSVGLKNHLLFRNYLRSHPEKAKEYGALKQQLAAQYPDNMDLYVENKTAFITAILKETGLDEEKLKDITAQNKA